MFQQNNLNQLRIVICYVQNFMTMTYKIRNVYYIPYRTRRSAVIIDKDLCGHYTVDTPQPFDFDHL